MVETIKAAKMTENPQLYTPNFLLIGESGAGKTHSLRTFPPDWKVLVVDLFGNKETLAGASNVEIVSYSDIEVSDSMSWPLVKKESKEIREACLNKEYQVVALDTVTGLTRFNEFFVLRAHPDKLGVGGSPAQHHYRGMSHMVGEFIMDFINTPCYTVVICHAEMNEDDGMLTYRAIMTGKRWRNTIYSYLGQVYRAFAEIDPEAGGEETTQYIWQTQPDRRWPMLKDVMNSPTGYHWGKFVRPNFHELLYRRGVVKDPPEGYEGPEPKELPQ